MGAQDEPPAALPGSAAMPPAKRRRLNGPALSPHSPGTKDDPVDLVSTEHIDLDTSRKDRKLKVPSETPKEERRLRVFRKKAPQSYLERLARAQSQRMFVISRRSKGTEDTPGEIIDLAGSTGNIYTITIDRMPSCTCPDNIKGNQCKHIVYILCNVLKAPTHLRYQLAFISSELREIFSRAPTRENKSWGRKDPNRKPIEGDCPICFTSFQPKTEAIVYCRSSCGNNVHKECFQQWATAQIGKDISCVYCRAPWQCDDEMLELIQRLIEKRKDAAVNDEGYLNVAEELGLSGVRDVSTYHQPWVQQRGRSIRYPGIL